MDFGKECHRGEMPFSSHHSRGIWEPQDFGDVNLHYLVKVVFAGLLHCEVIIFPFILYSLNASK